ncbi:MAG TPA: hypothetical protein IGS17_13635 [Oscillatoriales cyanobacterium M59_W2019_021]|nr:MAG: hypothetical protein D6728_14845 [Cyanobacteria bacterium J055]HIK30761.1 hypothetical protein [Oscillatoriales cyanobacterium M4454_W2019_049]HIK51946.1 hypothetical protein [Oscillatoriales cyanobacterium M59_W2019_021]
MFSNFKRQDLLEIARSCRQAFKDCFDRELEEIYPHCPRIETPDCVREILETYDDPELAVAFANRTIALIQKLEEGDRDVSKEIPFIIWECYAIARNECRLCPVKLRFPAPAFRKNGYIARGDAIHRKERANTICPYNWVKCGTPNPIAQRPPLPIFNF